jgi:hypothetical protein
MFSDFALIFVKIAEMVKLMKNDEYAVKIQKCWKHYKELKADYEKKAQEEYEALALQEKQVLFIFIWKLVNHIFSLLRIQDVRIETHFLNLPCLVLLMSAS